MMLIAECGVNWNDLGELITMFTRAKYAGAEAVKVQVFDRKTIKKSRSLHQKTLLKLILDEVAVKDLSDIAHRMGLCFVATPMYPEAVEMVAPSVEAIKIRYADRYNLPLITEALKVKKNLLVSCDEAYLEKEPPDSPSREAREAVLGQPEPMLMYCVPEYPPKQFLPPETLGTLFKGFSSHYPNPWIPITAAMMRCTTIEVHVTPNPKPARRGQYSDSMRPFRYIDDPVSLTFDQLAFVSEKIKKPWGRVPW